MWKTHKILFPSLTPQAQRAMSACYVVKKTWRREDMTVAALKAFWAYSGYYKNAQGQLVEDGSPICGSCKKKVVEHIQLTLHLRDDHP